MSCPSWCELASITRGKRRPAACHHHQSDIDCLSADRPVGERLPNRVYSSEPDEPAHVHAHKAGCEAKFWLAPVQLSWNKAFARPIWRNPSHFGEARNR